MIEEEMFTQWEGNDEFDELFEDEEFRKEIWVLIMLYLYIKDAGAENVHNTFLKDGKNPFQPIKEE